MSEDVRAVYRRKMQQRQTVLFGSIAAVLAVLMVLSMLVWAGILPFPFNKEFKRSDNKETIITPCIAEGTPVVDLGSINVSVYNSTSGSGFAASVGKNLTDLGVVVSRTDNWGSESDIDESARIITGSRGIAAAYTIAQYFPGSKIQYDSSVTEESISIVIGDAYLSAYENGGTTMLSADEVAMQNPDGTLSPAEGCTNVAEGGED